MENYSPSVTAPDQVRSVSGVLWAPKSPVAISISADIISCVEFNNDGELLATGDKAGRVVIFQRDQAVSTMSGVQ